jgi:transposase, IS5 family
MQKEIFQPEAYLNPKWYIFKEQTLGKIHETIPWDLLAECLPKDNSGPGAPRWFDNKGMLGLLFLKAYLNISDRKLIEQFNTDYSLQIFCGRMLKSGERIKGKSAIVSQVRSYVAQHCDWHHLQEVLIGHWKRDMDNTHVLMMDATCYESYIRFPTDVKLLWESCQWIFEKQLFYWSKKTGEKRPRSKYKEQKRKQLAYDRTRKKTWRQGRRRHKSLLYLLGKGVKQLQELFERHPAIEPCTHEREYLKTIKKVLEQQRFMETHPVSELKDRIVSLPKPYIRPIVRGKENKRVEFGMKTHMLQVDGLCFFDAISFNAFNESTRLPISVLKHRSWFGRTNQLAADRIYATNANRRYLTEKNIFSCFPKKDGKEESGLKSVLSAVRSTVLEGSFGVHKESYGLRKIKAKNEKNEIIWAFFGVMMCNAALIAKRRARGAVTTCKSAA